MYIQVTKHSIERYRERILDKKELFVTDEEIKTLIKKEVLSSMRHIHLLGSGLYALSSKNGFLRIHCTTDDLITVLTVISER